MPKSDDGLLKATSDPSVMLVSDSVAGLGGLNMRAVGITVLLLALLIGGQYIVVPGVDTFQVEEMMRATHGHWADNVWARVSVLALGVMPWITAAAIVEVVGIVIPPLRSPFGFRGRHCDPFSFPVLALAVLVAAVQAYGIAVALNAANLLVSNTNLIWLLVIFSLTCGVVIHVVVARLIDHFGTGYGFWLCLGLTVPLALIIALSRSVEAVRLGVSDLGSILLPNAVAFLAIIIVSAILVRALFTDGRLSVSPILFPVLAAGLITDFALGLTLFVWPELEATGIAGITVAHALFVSIIVCALLWRSLHAYGAINLWVLSAVSCIAMIVLPQVMQLTSNAPNAFWFNNTTAAASLAFFIALAAISRGFYSRL
ncbi:MAG: hypothetical protein AAFO77_04850 [Pseudomonadota bacterium]